MTATSALRSWRLSPLVRRIHVDPDERFDRLPDPALCDAAFALIDAGRPDRELPEMPVTDGGAPVPLSVSKQIDGTVTISAPLAPGERLYGACDADATGIDRRGDHVHLVTEIHAVGGYAHTTISGCATCDHDASPPVRRTPAGEVVDCNYSEVVVPFFTSSRGYAIYISNLTHGAVLDLGSSVADAWTYTAPGGDADVYVIGPCDTRQALATFADLTGHMPLPPVWALGFLQSRFGYESFDHVRSVIERFGEELLPLHGIILDVQWLEDHVNLKWDPDNFPDPESNLAWMAARGVRTMVITEPGTREDSTNFESGAAIDAFARAASGDRYDADQWYARRSIDGYRSLTDSRGALVNFYRESVTDWWYDQHTPLVDQGVDAWWLDLNEPEDVGDDVVFAPVDWPEKRAQLPGTVARNSFALAQQRAFTTRDAQSGTRRPVLVTRSGCAGSQRYGAAPWTGDIGATWDDVQLQPRLLLNLGMSGIPLAGCDIGGFFGDPGPELFTRWMQAGAFFPMFRAHGNMRDREPWSQGAAALAAIRPTLELRARLLLSIATWMRVATAAGLPLMRPMLLEDPDDPRFHSCEDQWMFGDLLVAPVLEPGVTSRRVELPAGDWFDLWTGDSVAGGGHVEVSVALRDTPVFVRAGTVLFSDPSPTARRSYTWPPDRLDVRVFPPSGSSNATETLWADDGVTSVYQKGEHGYWRVDSGDGELCWTRVSGTWGAPITRRVPPRFNAP